MAKRVNSTKIVKELIRDASRNAIESALMEAVEKKGNRAIVKLLLPHSSANAIESALIKAAKKVHIEVVKELHIKPPKYFKLLQIKE